MQSFDRRVVIAAFSAFALTASAAAALQQPAPEPVSETEFRIVAKASLDPELVRRTTETLRRRLADVGQGSLEVVANDEGRVLVRWQFEVREFLLQQTIVPRVERAGAIEFLAVIESKLPGIDPIAERKFFDDWRKLHPNEDTAKFNELAAREGGPTHGLLWLPMRRKAIDEPQQFLLCDARGRADPKLHFDERDFGKVERVVDGVGYPAIGFSLREERRDAFSDFTESIKGRQIAIVIDGEILTAPRVLQRLGSTSTLEGRFSQAERDNLFALLRPPAERLPYRLEFVATRALK